VEAAALLVTASTMATPARAGALPPERELLNLTNAARARVGAAPLSLDSELGPIAQRWAGQMTTLGRLLHNPNLARECQNWQRLAENIGVGPDIAGIQRAFENSAVHYRNMINPELQTVGVGVVAANGALWVTLDFKSPQTSLPAPVVAAPRPAPVRAVGASPVPPKPTAKPAPAPERAPPTTPVTPPAPATPTSRSATGQTAAATPARAPHLERGAALGAAILLLAASCSYRMTTRTVLARPSGNTIFNRPLRVTPMR
jgi:hypothetical protein